MKKAHLHINKRGFSLVEILVAISVFLVFVLATTGVMVSFSKNSRHVANSERATILAEEAIEVSRNLRDSAFDFGNLPDGTYGLSTSGNQWNLSGSSDTQDIFTREVVISTEGINQKKIDVTISWSDSISLNNSVNTSTYLTDWKTIQTGFTLNKIVINHGGTKTVDDFAPYEVTTTVYAGDPPEPVEVTTTITLDESTLLNYGTYIVSETTDPNYTQTFSGDCDAGGSFTISSADPVSCTITNEEQHATLTVNKIVINDVGTKIASDFAPYKYGTNTIIEGEATNVEAGTYTISETTDPNYTQTFSGDCDANGSVALAVGESKTCTITNEEIATPPSCIDHQSFLGVDISGVLLTNNNRTLSGITIENTSTNCDIIITDIGLTWTSNRRFQQIYIGGSSVWSGNTSSGTSNDITDFTLGSLQSGVSTEYLFNNSINGNTFSITFTMSDGTTKTVTGISP